MTTHEERDYQPPHKLTAIERAEVLAVANSDEFGHLPPSQIVPRLADQGSYLASESTFYRILREEKQLAHRRSERPAQSCEPAVGCVLGEGFKASNMISISTSV